MNHTALRPLPPLPLHLQPSTSASTSTSTSTNSYSLPRSKPLAPDPALPEPAPQKKPRRNSATAAKGPSRTALAKGGSGKGKGRHRLGGASDTNDDAEDDEHELDEDMDENEDEDGLSPPHKGAEGSSGGKGNKADKHRPPPPKRVKVGARASIACATCRKRKVRCSGAWPSCAFCGVRSLACVYEGHPAENGGPLNAGAGSPFGLANFLPMNSKFEPILPPLPVMLKALDVFFQHNYDTFYFLHRPTLTEDIRHGTAPKELVCCILAFAGRFCDSLQELHPSSPTAASEHYAALAAQVLSAETDVSLVRCQCYLMLGLYECTEGIENRGWMKIGIAIRCAQVLRLGFDDEEDTSTSTQNSDPNSNTAQRSRRTLQSEIRRRTFWSCFLLDRTITDGKERPCALRIPPISFHLRLPGPDSDFILGKPSLGARFDPDPPAWSISTKIDSTFVEPEADLYAQTVRMSEIWGKVASYVGSGGRNHDRRAPWLYESTFATLGRELETFRRKLPEVFNFCEANLVAHCMINSGRLFGMLHLLFACSTLVLHRDYLPFLPPMDFRAANGPIDGEPLFGEPLAPEGWWQASLDQAFEAARTISDLCNRLSQHGSQITHPFAGYAALAAGTLHAHLKYWPSSSSNSTSTSPSDGSFYLDQDIAILSSLKSVYRIATSWTDGILKLHVLYLNLHRGVLDSDPSKIRASVIKLLRTKEDESAGGGTRPASPERDRERDRFGSISGGSGRALSNVVNNGLGSYSLQNLQQQQQTHSHPNLSSALDLLTAANLNSPSYLFSQLQDDDRPLDGTGSVDVEVDDGLLLESEFDLDQAYLLSGIANATGSGENDGFSHWSDLGSLLGLEGDRTSIWAS